MNLTTYLVPDCGVNKDPENDCLQWTILALYLYAQIGVFLVTMMPKTKGFMKGRKIWSVIGEGHAIGSSVIAFILFGIVCYDEAAYLGERIKASEVINCQKRGWLLMAAAVSIASGWTWMERFHEGNFQPVQVRVHRGQVLEKLALLNCVLLITFLLWTPV